MSANRDRDQRVTFVYSNFYQLYKKGKEAAIDSSVGQTSAVLKAGDRRVVENYEPIALMARKTKPVAPPLVAAPSALPASTTLPIPKSSYPGQSQTFQNHAVKSLKDNLKTLNDLHSRLNFMLKELEELVKE